MALQSKQPWNHTTRCDYCKSQNVEMADVHYENGASGCRHYRGGKSASDNKRSWPKLKIGATPVK